MRQFITINTPKQGFGTAEVGITLALVAVLMIGFLVLGSNLKLGAGLSPNQEGITATPLENSETLNDIVLRTPN